MWWPCRSTQNVGDLTASLIPLYLFMFCVIWNNYINFAIHFIIIKSFFIKNSLFPFFFNLVQEKQALCCLIVATLTSFWSGCKRFYLTYNIANNLQDFLSVRLYWNLDSQLSLLQDRGMSQCLLCQHWWEWCFLLRMHMFFFKRGYFLIAYKVGP